MTITFKIVFFLVLLVSVTSCFDTDWTKEEYEAFSKTCSETIEFNPNSILFSGFSREELENLIILEKNAEKTMDTLDINISKERGDYEKRNERFWGSVDAKLKTNYKYEFIINDVKPYVIDNFEMVPHSEYTMFNQDYGCGLGSYALNGVVFSDTRRIEIKKRGFELNKE